jgi:hypothetical protein
MSEQRKQNWLIAGLTMVALVAMIAAYFSPIWWVALTAPNYPKDAFPDGIRIHFHFNGVNNGCHVPEHGSVHQNEVLQGDITGTEERYNPILDANKDLNKGAQGLDCLHEMNTINHYVGMFPIETGASVERPMSKFIISFFVTMLVAFVVPSKRLRLGILGAGFTAVAAWMIVDLYVLGHMEQFVRHYQEEGGMYFPDTERLRRWADNLRMAIHGTTVGLIAAMVVVLLGVWRIRGFTLLLALVPALLPLFFVIDYAGWLWFFGHTLHPWGAFTVKPFMPTVFGEGKVAQFSTYSYPYWGYGLLVLVFLALMPAVLLRRKQMRDQDQPES